MKKFLCVLLAVLMLTAVVAIAVSCGQEDVPDGTTSIPTETETETDTEAKPEDTQPETSESETKPVTDTSDTEPVTDTSDTDTSTSDTDPGTTPPSTQPEIVVPTQYADVDFGGKTFNIIYRYQTAEEKPSGWGQVFDLYIDEENPDDALSAAVKLFTAYMGSTFNCTVVGTPALEAGTVLSNAIDTHDATYDMGIYNTSPAGFANGKYYNLLPMLNLDLTCWDQAVLRDLTIGNKLYGITGNCSTSDDDYTWVMFFNKTILAENNLEYPYQLVKDGKWTIDKFLEYSRACQKELDGDDVISNDTLLSIVSFCAVYIITWLVGTLVLCISRIDVETCMAASILSLGNIGIGFGKVGPAGNFSIFPLWSLWVCSFEMLLGRLEIFTVLVVFSRSFWKR